MLQYLQYMLQVSALPRHTISCRASHAQSRWTATQSAINCTRCGTAVLIYRSVATLWGSHSYVLPLADKVHFKQSPLLPYPKTSPGTYAAPSLAPTRSFRSGRQAVWVLAAAAADGTPALAAQLKEDMKVAMKAKVRQLEYVAVGPAGAHTGCIQGNAVLLLVAILQHDMS